MKHSYLKLCLVMILISFLGTEASGAEKAKSWRVQMMKLSAALADAIPYLYPDPSRDPKELNSKVERIYEISKSLDPTLDHSSAAFSNDPIIPYVAQLFRSDIERSYKSLKEGHIEYAKSVLRSSVSNCIACHTRMQGGAEFQLIASFHEPLKKASWIDRIEFQAASRQFDPVITEVMQQLDKPGTLGISQMDLERAVRIALSIAVRVKQDPSRARFLVESILKSPSSTPGMKEAARAWRGQISDWQSEKSKNYGSDVQLIEKARRLISDSKGEHRSMIGYSEVEYLRASVLMHDLLTRFPKSPYSAEAMYIIGLSYDFLRELGLWSLHEMYYQACIERSPHSRQAELCFDRYKQSMMMGYSGSSGIHLPVDVSARILELSNLAKRVSPKR